MGIDLCLQTSWSDRLDDSAALPAEHRSAGAGPVALPQVALKRQVPGGYIPNGVGQPPALPAAAQGTAAYPTGPVAGQDDAWPLSTPTDQPQIKNLQVQCEKTHMRVNVEFDRPFYGMIFSKGHYSEANCVHVRPGTGQLSATFDIYLNSCGMTSSANQAVGAAFGQPSPAGTFVENTIIIQYDPLVQEVWDQARRLRCTWYDYYEKSVTFRPFAVDMINAVTANFLGDNLQCWMQIQVGKGPWASEVSGIVKIGQTMTMVLAIKDDENKFDMLVRNCVAHDGLRAPIQLVDQYGCVTRPKIMSRFQKVRNFGPSASVVSYAYFQVPFGRPRSPGPHYLTLRVFVSGLQAFKFPDSMNVHFQCVIQVCRNNCPEPKCDGGAPADLGYAASTNVNAAGVDPRVPAAVASAQVAPGGVPVPVNRPAPPAYTSVNRDGVAASERSSSSTAGRPRTIDTNATAQIRSRRSLHVYKRDAQVRRPVYCTL